MHTTTARRAGASLVALISTPPCRATQQRARQRLAYPRQRRDISTSTSRWQQQTQPAAAVSTTPSQPARAPSPPPAANQVKPDSDRHALSPANDAQAPLRSLTDGLVDPPPLLDEDEKQVDWTRSYHGLSSSAFTPEQAQILQQDLSPDDIEVKPDGIVYLPEIKYRRILNKAFGPGGWGLAPRGETIVTGKLVTREYGLVCGGRLVSVARGEQQYFDPDGIPTATEGCKSNALMRCCKDLGIASELWDPRFIRKFLVQHAREALVEHAMTKKRRKHWLRKDDAVKFPLKEIPISGQPQQQPQRAGAPTSPK